MKVRNKDSRVFISLIMVGLSRAGRKEWPNLVMNIYQGIWFEGFGFMEIVARLGRLTCERLFGALQCRCVVGWEHSPVVGSRSRRRLSVRRIR